MKREFAADNVAVVTICLGGSADQARAAMRDAGVDLPILLDDSYQASSAYRSRATPTTFLIDGNGVIRLRKVGYGPSTGDQLRAEILRVLAEAQAGEP